MKKIQKIAAATCLGLGLLGSAVAAGHYEPGVEGIDSSAAPPPGLYYLAYLVNYQIDSVSGLPGNNTGSASILANRVVWLTSHKFLGANYGMEALIPVQATSLTFNGIGVSSTSRGIGDIYLGPVVLSWAGADYGLVFAAGEWLSNGSYSSTDPSSLGLGYRSTMLTFGGTYYPDERKLWSVSALARFEKNGTQSQTGITPGDGLSVEWGIGREIGGGKKIGLVGYVQNQTSSSSGPGANPENPRKSGIGVEFDLPVMSQGMMLKFAGYKEYSASSGATKGTLLRMTIVKRF